MRIVSLLPSTTEILFALGAGDDVVGVTFECDHPPQARERRVVSSTALPAGLTPAEIDAYVTAAVRNGEDLYHLDAGALADLEADLVVTQDLCAVCAVDVDTVDQALTHLGCGARVVTVDPQRLDDVLASISTLGLATGRGDAAACLVADLRRRLAAVTHRVQGLAPPRVLVLEWTDPAYSAGHWIPDLVTAAGGVPVLGEAGDRSVPLTWEAVGGAEADLVVVAPCGFDLAAATALTADLVAHDLLPDAVPVYAADANAAWTRPGPRLVDGVEDLAAVLHPDAAVGLPKLMARCR